MSDFQSLYTAKLSQLSDLSQQFTIFQTQSNQLISQLQSQNLSLKRKLDLLSQDLLSLHSKSKLQISSLQRQLQQCKKQRFDFMLRYEDVVRKLVDLQNVVETLEGENRASEYMLREYEERVEKTMEELAMVRIVLEEKEQDLEERMGRLRGQLRETEDELEVVRMKHQKYSEEVSCIRFSCVRGEKQGGRKEGGLGLGRGSFGGQQSSGVGKSGGNGNGKGERGVGVGAELNRIIGNLEREIRGYEQGVIRKMTVTH